MERGALVVCAVVGFLGLLSAVLGFAAEAKKIKVSDVQTTIDGECVYPKSPALELGLSSAIALIAAQAIINTTAGCICCKKRTSTSDANWTIGLISFVISWVAFIVAFLMLLAGAALNNQHNETKYLGHCYVIKPGVFSGGAILSFASVSLGIMYYLTLSTYKSMGLSSPQHNQGIAMGQPQVPPRSTQPIFVQEDTYQRQQFP